MKIGRSLDKMPIFSQKYSIEMHNIFLPMEKENLSFYSKEDDDEDSEQEYDIITNYIELKCRNNREFENNLNKIIDKAKEKYSELHNFLRECNGMANNSKIEFGYKLLEGSKKIMNNIITICEFNEINLYQQYKK